MESNNKYKGKTLTFNKLLDQHSIEIPIIQRDYAQGREDKEEILMNFLNTLHDSIVNNNAIKLDFIYGSNNKSVFQPLDGQQRLTTLFLIYWYAMSQNKENYETGRPLLSKFTYETRVSSRDFCNVLINNDIVFNDNTTSIKELIIDSNWFYLSWKKDPTIDSMLRSIDHIHSIFKDIDNLWDILNSNKELISFYHVDLENIGLTDDLYIKMNARGKLLSSFENFKASFQGYIEEKGFDKGKNFIDKFEFRIDNEWTDYFWANFRTDNSIDEAFMRFIAVIAMTQFSCTNPQLTSEKRSEVINLLQDNYNKVRPFHFPHQVNYQYLYDVFNLYKKIIDHKYDLSLDFPLWRHKYDVSLLSHM